MPKPTSNTSELMRYAGMGTQMLVSLGLAVLAGYKLDKWTRLSFPLFVLLLPVIVLAVLIYQLIKDTSKKNGSTK